MEDQLERIYYTFESWQKDDLPWSLWYFRFGEAVVHHTEEDVHKMHVLPESEYNKIIAKKKEILNVVTGRYLGQIIDEIKTRIAASIDKKQLVENEIARVEKILKDENYKGSLVPYVHGSIQPFTFTWGFSNMSFLNRLSQGQIRLPNGITYLLREVVST
jgi:hypothetical protein